MSDSTLVKNFLSYGFYCSHTSRYVSSSPGGQSFAWLNPHLASVAVFVGGRQLQRASERAALIGERHRFWAIDGPHVPGTAWDRLKLDVAVGL